jgi:S-adenosylmethionine:tRNA ribosyltransferase-isomerase
VNTSDFDYYLPPQLIAERPAEPRDSSNLLVLEKESGQIIHDRFFDLGKYLKQGDLLVLNSSKVIPARLFGQRKMTGGKVEILLNHEIEDGLWQVVGKNLKIGDCIIFDGGKLSAMVEQRQEQLATLRFNLIGEVFFQEIEKNGQMPLPPYIQSKRQNMQNEQKLILGDKNDYQTIYAKAPGSVAAPTAGLHFTSQLLDGIQEIGVSIAEITLHVGLGTFQPIKTEKITDHKIHSEYYSVDAKVLQQIRKTKAQGGRIIAVGTTTTRVLEHIHKESLDTSEASLTGWTEIYIYPGFKFKCVDGLITNFHLPKSSLLCLVSALAGKDKIDSAYKSAIQNDYRFYSYGDAMLII